jgi:hypothetical protein
MLAWSAVWVTGSRTAFGLAAIISGFAVIALSMAARDRSGMRITRRGVPVLGAVVLALVLLVANLNFTASGPIQRLSEAAPGWSLESVRAFALEMWNRNRYGEVATSMIREYPWFGVGISGFPVLVSDFALRASGTGLTPDNAQNWYRHQFVEFGLIGSLAWIVWVVAFAVFVLKRRRDGPAVLWIPRGMLIGFAFISLVGMPAQDVAVGITFWTAAFWFVGLAGQPQPQRALPNRSWLIVLTLVVVFAVGTAHAATSRLRPALRAQEFGWPYSYGFYPPEPDPSGGERRWARRRAVAVVPVTKPRLKIQVSVDHRDLVADPVHARIWVHNSLVVDVRLSTPAPVVRHVAIPRGAKWIAIESAANRVLKPADFGVADARELGLLLKWEFVDRPL